MTRLHGDVRSLAIVGLAPAKGSEPGEPALAPAARTGRRLEDLLGCPVTEIACTANVLPTWRSALRGSAALLAGQELRDRLVREEVLKTVVLGNDAARLMGLRYGEMRASHWFRWEVDHRLYYAVAPHPSGLSRWWNDPENAERARAFFAELGAWGKGKR